MRESTFATTRWTRILAAQGPSEEARQALSDLCAAYYAPVVAFLSRTGHDADSARELAHDFFEHLLSRQGLEQADPSRGRFRSYLLGAVRHFVANRVARGGRWKRGGRTLTVPFLDCPAEPAGTEAAFDRDWAVALLARAMIALASEAEAAGLSRQFSVLRPWLAAEGSPLSQSEIGARLGMSETAVKVAIHRLRRRFRALVRAEIVQTLPATDDIAGEMNHLIAALSQNCGTRVARG